MCVVLSVCFRKKKSLSTLMLKSSRRSTGNRHPNERSESTYTNDDIWSFKPHKINPAPLLVQAVKKIFYFFTTDGRSGLMCFWSIKNAFQFVICCVSLEKGVVLWPSKTRPLLTTFFIRSMVMKRPDRHTSHQQASACQAACRPHQSQHVSTINPLLILLLSLLILIRI